MQFQGFFYVVFVYVVDYQGCVFEVYIVVGYFYVGFGVGYLLYQSQNIYVFFFILLCCWLGQLNVDLFIGLLDLLYKFVFGISQCVRFRFFIIFSIFYIIVLGIRGQGDGLFNFVFGIVFSCFGIWS